MLRVAQVLLAVFLCLNMMPVQAAPDVPSYLVRRALFEDEGVNGWVFTPNLDKRPSLGDTGCGGVVDPETASLELKIRRLLISQLGSNAYFSFVLFQDRLELAITEPRFQAR